MEQRQPVEILTPEVSRRIAAGEVIERPASVIRELIDNSIDAGADKIDVSWSGGGAELLRVHDNGFGMDRRDLELCWKPHATSKIRTLEDLEHSKSLGFRGEALASIAAVSALTVTTTGRNAKKGHRLVVDQATLRSVDPAPPTPGTTVEVHRLFANLPARRRFLSRPQAETTAIRNVIMDKALPFPDIRFSFQSEGGKRTVLPGQSLTERTAEVFGSAVPVHSLREIRGSGDGFSITVVAAEPEIVRRDRRYIRVFVNNRRVWEYGLIQAVEYAYQDVQHGGMYPAAAVLVDINPELIDFNIHPAKREVRIRPSGELHHRLVEIMRSFLKAYALRAVQLDREFPDSPFTRRDADAGRPLHQEMQRPPAEGNRGAVGGPGRRDHGGFTVPRASYGSTRSADLPVRHVAEKPSFQPGVRAVPSDDDTLPGDDRYPLRAADSEELAVRGTVFGTYIVAEWEERLFLIDQHAAHERLLYDYFREKRSSQSLLIPETFDLTDDQHARLSAHVDEYREIGIRLEHVDGLTWQLTAVPDLYRDDAEVIVEMVAELEGLQEQLDRQIVAEVACKAAVKGGDFVDNLTALELARKTLRLEPPRCPHGRPLWIELTRLQLDRLIGRV